MRRQIDRVGISSRADAWFDVLGNQAIPRSCDGTPRKPYSDGTMEWDDMNFFWRANEVALGIFSTIVVAPLLGVLALLALSVAAAGLGLSGDGAFIDYVTHPAALAFLALCIGWYGYWTIMDIVESKRRTRGRQNADVLPPRDGQRSQGQRPRI